MRFSSDNIYIVTGVFSGIGESIALYLNALGATVIGIGRDVSKQDNFLNKVQYPENMKIEIRDLTVNIEQLPLYIKELSQKYGKFNGLISCAGISKIHPLKLIDIDEYCEMFSINFLVPLFLAKGFADKRVRAENSSILAISSAAAIENAKGMALYSASKAALASAYISLGRELTPKGVRVNLLSPTDIDTPMATKLNEFRNFEPSQYPLGIGKPIDVAKFAAFLVSDDAKWISCQNYVVDCGSL